MDNAINKWVKKAGLPVVSTSLLSIVLVLGIASGAFMYATGQNVLSEVYMQMVSHTEYRYAESGQVVARLVNFAGDPVAVDNCTANILYPDKTSFVSDALMSDSNIVGDHYYNFTTPNGPEGVYEYQATCYYTVGAQTRNASVTNSFHLSGAFNQILTNISDIRSDIADLSLQLDANITEVLTSLNNIDNKIDVVNNTLNTQFADIQSNFSDVFTSFSTIQTNFSDVLTAISAIQVPEVVYLAQDSAENGVPADHWSTIGSATLTYSAGDGFDNSVGILFNVSNGAINFTDGNYTALTRAQRLDGVTYEFMMYDTGNVADDQLFFFDWNDFTWYIGTDDAVVGNAYIGQLGGSFPENSFDTSGRVPKRVGWHKFSMYFYDYDSVADTVSVIVSLDGERVFFGEGLTPPTNMDPGFWVENNPGVGRIDDFRVYTGYPEDDGEFMFDYIANTLETFQNDTANEFDYLNTTLQSRFDTIDSTLATITTNQGVINTTTNNIYTLLQTVDTTTTNTYNYVTGTLANNVDNILTDLGVINATVNRIETVTTDINSTVNSILQNQEDEVHMTVFSG